ncbi:MAG: hypothetical protein JWP97_138 [Labilithrix sp.]|nr:hypothetical protein [Labilithrix sp.]
MKEDDALTQAANSTGSRKAVDSRNLVSSSSRKSPDSSRLTIEALYSIQTTGPVSSRPNRDPREPISERGACADDCPDEGERARLISDISRLIREPQMPEPTRCAGLTLIGWLARRMPGEAPHAIGVHEAARQSERRIRPAQRKPR